jgi:beta-glucosidase
MAMPWENENLSAILQAWYPGEEGGTAVAQVLFGEVNPGGRLPITIYAATKDLPPFEDYSMVNRTYRYFKGKPLYAFGHGLSYTKFDYSDAKIVAPSVSSNGAFHLTFTLKNTGALDGDEVPQVYFSRTNTAANLPQLALCGFARVHLAKGTDSSVSIDIPAQRFRHWDESKKSYTVDPGDYDLKIGGASDDLRLTTKVSIKGN